MGRIISLAMAALTLLGGATAAEFELRPAAATLKDAERNYPRVSLEKDWRPTYPFGDRRYRVVANTVSEVSGAGKPTGRTVSVAAEYRLRWLGAAEGIAFLAADREAVSPELDDRRANRRFHRLHLDSMKWLDSFTLPEPSIKPTRSQESFLAQYAKGEPKTLVTADQLLVTPRGIVVMSVESAWYRHTSFPDSGWQAETSGYHVSCYAAKDTTARWHRALRSTSRSVSYPIPFTNDSVQRLTYVAETDNDQILVCPGERDALNGLSAVDGKVRWRIPAIWEFDRGFIGPSVYEYYIERFGLDYLVMQSAKAPLQVDGANLRQRVRDKMQATSKFAAARKKFYALYQGRITAGPIVAPGANDFGRPRIYMATTRSLKTESGAAEQPEHAFLYEITPNDGAEITGMARLPRPVTGPPYRKVPGGMVLSCDQGCLLRLRTYESVFHGMMGPGNADNDLVLQLDWYREYLMHRPAAWLIADPPMNVAGFSAARLFRPSRAFIREADDKVYELQINVVDLRTGLDRDLTLSLPFQGRITLPDYGNSVFQPGKSEEQIRIHGPLSVRIEGLSIQDKRLAVVIADGPSSMELVFDLSALLADE